MKVEVLRNSGYNMKFTIYYYNQNIHPCGDYEVGRAGLRAPRSMAPSNGGHTQTHI